MEETLPYETLPALVGATGGITAIVGSGGKTTTMRRIVELLESPGNQGRLSAGGETRANPEATPASAPNNATPPRHRIIVGTTTHVQHLAPLPLYTGADVHELAELLERRGTVQVGTPVEDGTKFAPSPIDLDKLVHMADHVLLEADGSRGLPLKAHANHEPVIPAATRALVVVVGANGFDAPIAEVVHRPELFCAATGAQPTDAATPELVAKMLTHELPHMLEGCAPATVTIVVTHVDDDETRASARRFQAALERPVIALNHLGRSLVRIA